jgi:hypothetical protein
MNISFFFSNSTVDFFLFSFVEICLLNIKMQRTIPNYLDQISLEILNVCPQIPWNAWKYFLLHILNLNLENFAETRLNRQQRCMSIFRY